MSFYRCRGALERLGDRGGHVQKLRGSWVNHRGDRGEKVGIMGVVAEMDTVRARIHARSRSCWEVAIAKLCCASMAAGWLGCARKKARGDEAIAGPHSSEGRGVGGWCRASEREKGARAAWAGSGLARKKAWAGIWVLAQSMIWILNYFSI